MKSVSPLLRGGVKGEPSYRTEIAEIIRQVILVEKDLQTFVLGELGITPIWFRDYVEIPGIIDEILKQRK